MVAAESSYNVSKVCFKGFVDNCLFVFNVCPRLLVFVIVAYYISREK